MYTQSYPTYPAPPSPPTYPGSYVQMQILSAPAGGTTSAPGTLITGPQLSISSGTPFTGVTAEWIVEKESYTNAEGVRQHRTCRLRLSKYGVHDVLVPGSGPRTTPSETGPPGLHSYHNDMRWYGNWYRTFNCNSRLQLQLEECELGYMEMLHH